MGYLEITAIVFACISAVFAIFTAHYFFFTIIGIFARKKFKPREEKLRYGIVIGARNEETVIAALIDSIKSNNYPQDKIEIFVAAHNCTDRTAEIAREHGATVYEYDNPDERTVGYAYKYIFDCIDRDFGTMSFDGFFIINADNVLTPDYISKMNDAFLHYDKKNVITSYRNSGNIGDNYMSCLYGLYFLSACRFEARGRTLCNCSTRVSGTGYVMPSELVKDGWEYVTLTEDWEFTADKIARGHKVMHCDEAEFFDEQPTTVPVMLRQRMRWARGHTLVFFTKYFKLLKSIFTPKRKGGAANKYSAYDISVAIMPLGAIAVFTWLAHRAVSAFRLRSGGRLGLVRYHIRDRLRYIVSFIVFFGRIARHTRAQKNTQGRFFQNDRRIAAVPVLFVTQRHTRRRVAVCKKSRLEGDTA